MDTDLENLVSFFKDKNTNGSFEVGDVCIYQEGIVKGKVKILSKSEKNDFVEYDLIALENMSIFPLPKQFTCCFKVGYYGWSWRMSKVKVSDVYERIAKMQKLIPPTPKPFAVDPKFKKQIDELLSQVVEIADEGNAPYNLVVKQKEIQNQLRQLYGLLASKKLMVLFGGHKPPFVGIHYNVGAIGEFGLQISQCDYDDWEYIHSFFRKIGCKIDDWKERTYSAFPIAYWDLSTDPDFKHSKQKIYSIMVSYYDSHASGW